METVPTLPTTETGSKPAPGKLAYVQAFVNTHDIESGRDKLASPDLLRRWLVQHGLMDAGAAVGEGELRQALEAREAIRALLLSNNGLDVDPEAVATLNRIAGHDPLVVRFSTEGDAGLEPGVAGVGGALGRLLAIIYAAKAEGTWGRLKACLSDQCHWAFYDSSKNRSGSWCTMDVCGSRMKARAYRRRKAEEA